VVMTNGLAARHARTLTPLSRGKTPYRALLRRGVVPTAHAASSLSWRRRACRSVDAVADADWPRLACAVSRGGHAQHRSRRARPSQWPRTS